MTLKHMRILAAVCDCEGVTAAAQKLFFPSPPSAWQSGNWKIITEFLYLNGFQEKCI